MVVVAAAALVAGMVVTAAGPVTAGSAGGWQIVPTPNPAGPEGLLEGVSCPAPDGCVAVGTHSVTAGTQPPLVEVFDGRGWQAQPAPEPAGARTTALAAVSCPAASACVAVGTTTGVDAVGRAVAETWDGSRWLVSAPPTPVGAQSSALAGVSCAAPTACVAVGTFADGGGARHGLAEAWDGSRWALLGLATPPGSEADGLAAVSCPAPTACTAVGGFTPTGAPAGPFGPAQRPLAEAWDGSQWAIQAAPDGPGDTSSLAGVSCPAPGTCTAVGSSQAFLKKQYPVTLAERWNGASWTVQPTPNPVDGARGASFVSVSCPTASACTAVGGDVDGTRALVERFDGSAWTLDAPAVPSGAVTFDLAAVSCASSTSCHAVGADARNSGVPVPVAESSEGGGWRVDLVDVPDGEQDAALLAVSCPATSCMAVGSVATTGRGEDRRSVVARAPAISELWDGTRWSLLPVPTPAGGVGADLAGVSCPGGTAGCEGVGSYADRSGAEVTLAERWDGHVWTPQPTPNPAGTLGAQLTSVSCTSGDDCTAVGFALVCSPDCGDHTLAERWDGHRWSIEPTPNPDAADTIVGGVSCLAGGICTAVGVYIAGAPPSFAPGSTTSFSLAMRRTGGTWVIQPTPPPDNSPGSHDHGLGFQSVSCTSADACTAVGNRTSFLPPYPIETLAARWDGQQWTHQVTPNAGPGDTRHLGYLQGSEELASVSCTSSTTCTAVGSYAAIDGASHTLAARWDGSGWALSPTPDAPGALSNALAGVSCVDPARCTAVGSDAYPVIPPGGGGFPVSPHFTLAETDAGA
ncbi:MAG: hypothetical protein ABR511_06010 [Acidimicrobiales bacterium]